ncbi:MAG: SRPBCC domain-containing protein [Flavobacteriales bacterium]
MKAPETIVKRMVVINAAQETVWNALIKRGLAALHLLRENGYKPLKEGSTHVWYDPEDPDQQPRLHTHVTVLAPPRRIALMAYVPSSGLPNLPNNYTAVDIELAPGEDGRTVVRVEQGDFAAFHHGKKLAREAGNAWVEALIRLRERVEHEVAA